MDQYSGIAIRGAQFYLRLWTNTQTLQYVEHSFICHCGVCEADVGIIKWTTQQVAQQSTADNTASCPAVYSRQHSKLSSSLQQTTQQVVQQSTADNTASCPAAYSKQHSKLSSSLQQTTQQVVQQPTADNTASCPAAYSRQHSKLSSSLQQTTQQAVQQPIADIATKQVTEQVESALNKQKKTNQSAK